MSTVQAKLDACLREAENLEALRKKTQTEFSDQIYEFENVKSDAPNAVERLKIAVEEHARVKKMYDETKAKHDGLVASIASDREAIKSLADRYSTCRLRFGFRRFKINTNV